MAREAREASSRFSVTFVAQLGKNPPAMWETWVRFLSWEDPQEKGKRVPASVFWLGEFHGLYSPWGLKESDMSEPATASQGKSPVPP